MKLNADLSKRACVHRADAQWLASPMPGVERIMLDRDGDEVARATSLVRYASSSSFPAHTHGLGEEFLVLEGTFHDEHGEYPQHSYVRNPPGSRHTPGSATGCILFVKLRQFSPDDQRQIVVDTSRSVWQRTAEDGVECVPLHEYHSERVMLLRVAPGASLPVYPLGAEFLVLDGNAEDEEDQYALHDWLRNPPGSRARLRSAGGCTLYLKTGHLQ